MTAPLERIRVVERGMGIQRPLVATLLADIGGEIGQHNEEILLELGYDWDFISKLREQTQDALGEAFGTYEEEDP